MNDLDALVAAFLITWRRAGNSLRTRNARLAAIHSMFSFAALRHPRAPRRSSGSLAIPAKRDRNHIS